MSSFKEIREQRAQSDLGKLTARITEVLRAAGHQEGRHHRGSGWSDEGCLVYEPPIAGYMLETHLRYAKEPERSYALPAYSQISLDHAGKGRRQAMADYERLLREAGISFSHGALKPLGKKSVLWFSEVFDRQGGKAGEMEPPYESWDQFYARVDKKE